MIPVSDAYKEIMESNIRPKCEPVITVSGTSNTGEEIHLEWRGKNIKSMTYKRGIDPAGRTLPYMELEWTEIYTGKFNAQNYPEKYNNIAKYMAVDLSFTQSLGFYSTWKTIYDTLKTWAGFFTGNKTWKQVKDETSIETIRVPRMFLEARPTISGTTITWKAKDILYFLDEKIIKSFNARSDGNRINPAIYLLVDARGAFLNNRPLFDVMHQSVLNASAYANAHPAVLDKNVLLDGATKDLLMNYLSLWNLWLTYSSADGSFSIVDAYTPTVQQSFTAKTLFDYPKVTNGTDISTYNFKHYGLELDQSSAYTKTPYLYFNIQGNPVYRYDFKGYGQLADDTISAMGDVNYAISEVNTTLQIYPMNYNGYDNILDNKAIGESYVEDNQVNPFDKTTNTAQNRFAFLKQYFNKDCASLEFECLANPALETGDIISVITNLYDTSGEQIQKDALVVQFEITYNGSMKEKIIAHEVIL